MSLAGGGATVWAAAGATTAVYWCKDVARLTDVEVARAARVPENGSGHGPGHGRQVVDVGVSFHVRWRPFGNDGSMGSGSTTWGYELARTSAHAPWRIVSEGVG